MPGCDLPSTAVEIISDRLYWALSDESLEDTQRYHYFSIDEDLVYQPFCSDFGPLNLGMVHQYCQLLAAKLEDPKLLGRRIVHICSADAFKRANAAFLICAYQVIVMQRSAEAAFQPFKHIQPSFLGFRDALPRACNFRLTIEDCLEGLEKAIELGWFNWKTFDFEDYEFLDKVENCDANWIVPDKFLAFAGPSKNAQDGDGFPNVTPEDCLPIFQKSNIGLVVRLNRKDYDRKRFVDCGVRHVDLYFADGSCPPEEISTRFLHIAEQEPGAIAVHCKAGLGRTCTLIGLYVMKHYRFPARAFIGWARICRPGSVLGPQQQYLVDMQEKMFAAGAERYSTPPNPASVHCIALPGSSAPEQQEDVGQGERLCGAKRGTRPIAEMQPQPIPLNLPPNAAAQPKATVTTVHSLTAPSRSLTAPSAAPTPPQTQQLRPLQPAVPNSRTSLNERRSHAPPCAEVPSLPISKAMPSAQPPLRAVAMPVHPQVSTASSRTLVTTAVSSVKVPAAPPQPVQQTVVMRHSIATLPLDTSRPLAKTRPTMASVTSLGCQSPPASAAVPTTTTTWVSRTAPVSAF